MGFLDNLKENNAMRKLSNPNISEGEIDKYIAQITSEENLKVLAENSSYIVKSRVLQLIYDQGFLQDFFKNGDEKDDGILKIVIRNMNRESLPFLLKFATEIKPANNYNDLTIKQRLIMGKVIYDKEEAIGTEEDFLQFAQELALTGHTLEPTNYAEKLDISRVLKYADFCKKNKCTRSVFEVLRNLSRRDCSFDEQIKNEGNVVIENVLPTSSEIIIKGARIYS